MLKRSNFCTNDITFAPNATPRANQPPNNSRKNRAPRNDPHAFRPAARLPRRVPLCDVFKCELIDNPRRDDDNGLNAGQERKILMRTTAMLIGALFIGYIGVTLLVGGFQDHGKDGGSHLDMFIGGAIFLLIGLAALARATGVMSGTKTRTW
jgi:hypothetical protein